ncbi:MAG: HAD family phosphatase [Firmicutes bacterium]|nr:HAD family phosphatase [Bacillota bacterium]
MLDHQQIRWLLFDLDGTLLTTDKKVTERTLRDLEICRAKGIRIGVVTSRSKENAAQTIGKLHPDLVIASGGGIALYEGRVVYQADISVEETSRFIAEARRILGADAEITADTDSGHYWNYKVDPAQIDPSWGKSIYTDYSDFHMRSMKLCIMTDSARKAHELHQCFPDMDCVKFADVDSYKYSSKAATKERALTACEEQGILSLAETAAFGDDLPDIRMLTMCGCGVAMGNALPEVKDASDIVIGGNDEEGIAEYLETVFCHIFPKLS